MLQHGLPSLPLPWPLTGGSYTIVIFRVACHRCLLLVGGRVKLPSWKAPVGCLDEYKDRIWLFFGFSSDPRTKVEQTTVDIPGIILREQSWCKLLQGGQSPTQQGFLLIINCVTAVRGRRCKYQGCRGNRDYDPELARGAEQEVQRSCVARPNEVEERKRQLEHEQEFGNCCNQARIVIGRLRDVGSRNEAGLVCSCSGEICH